MASVTQCDICGNVVKHNECKYIEIFNVDKDRLKCGKIMGKDICDKCYKNLENIINKGE